MRDRNYLELDGVRGLAALTVALWHWLSFGRVRDPAWMTISQSLHAASEVAVLAFFVLSGFVLTHALERDRAPLTPRIAGFLLRRLFRIWPLAAAVVIGAFVVSWALAPLLPDAPRWPRYTPHDAGTLVAGLLLHDMRFNPPGWTLPYEIMGYLFIPALFLLARLDGLRALAAAVVAGALRAALVWYAGGWSTWVWAFSVGALLYWLSRHAILLGAQAATNGIVLAGAVVIAGAALWTDLPGYGPARTGLMAIWLAALLYLAIATPAGRWLASRPLRWLGRVSYSVYLVHYPLLWFTAALTTGSIEVVELRAWLLVGLVALPATLALSAVTHRFVEAPMIDLGRRLSAALSVRVLLQKTHAYRDVADRSADTL